MATFKDKSNVLVTCPFDPVHRMLESRYQAHVAKCKLNHPDVNLKTCPFNAQHIQTEANYSHHILNCPDRLAMDKAMSRSLYENELSKGRTAVPSYSATNLRTCSENWDNEIDPHGSAGYIPKGPILADGLIQDLGMMKPAERKKVYKNPAQALSERLENASPEIPLNPQVVRQPMMSSEGLYSALQVVQAGSAQSSPASSKIAANIFGPQNYLSSIASNNLGIGRGRGSMCPK